MNDKSIFDKQLLLKNFLAGTAIGGGTAAGMSLLNYLHSISERAKRRRQEDDDTTLYVDLPDYLSKQAADGRTDNLYNYAGSLLSVLLGAAIGHTGVRKLYKKYRLNESQKQVDDAQQVYLQSIAGTKQAASQDQFGVVSKALGIPAALSVLVALGSAAMANKILSDRFPVVKKAPSGPKRIVVRSRPGTIEKQIPAEGRAVHPDEAETLLRTAMADEKRASDSGLIDLVYAVAQGRAGEIERNIAEHGLDAACSLVKGASETPVSRASKNLAVSWLCWNPAAAPSVSVAAAAEFSDMAGPNGWMKMASHLEPEDAYDLFGIMGWVCRENRKRAFAGVIRQSGADMEKAAAALGNRMVGRLLVADVLARAASRKQEEEKLREEREGQENKVDFEVDGQEALEFLNANRDLLEQN